MSFWAFLKALFIFLPEVMKFVMFLSNKIEEGVEEAEIRRSVKKITDAFNQPDRQAAARQLNDIFRK